MNRKLVKEIINKWKNRPEVKEILESKDKRISLDLLEELDVELTPLVVEIKNTNSKDQGTIKLNRRLNVFISYHNLIYILKTIDPTFNYNYYILDANKTEKGDDLKIGAMDKIDGLAIEVTYDSTHLPLCLQKVFYPISDNKFNAIPSGKITVTDMESSIGRALAKTIAFNTGFGYGCWLNPNGVKASYFLNSKPSEIPNATFVFGNESSTADYRGFLESERIKRLNEKKAKEMVKEVDQAEVVIDTDDDTSATQHTINNIQQPQVQTPASQNATPQPQVQTPTASTPSQVQQPQVQVSQPQVSQPQVQQPQPQPTDPIILDSNDIDGMFNDLLTSCKQDPTVKLLKFKQIATSLYPRIRLAEYTQEQKKKVLDEFNKGAN